MRSSHAGHNGGQTVAGSHGEGRPPCDEICLEVKEGEYEKQKKQTG